MVSIAARRFWSQMASVPKQVELPIPERRAAGEHAEDATSEPVDVTFTPAPQVGGFFAVPPNARKTAAILYLFASVSMRSMQRLLCGI
jgi:epsilon-lactone hydrolase